MKRERKVNQVSEKSLTAETAQVPLTTGIDHVGLTVRDLHTTRAFFIDCLKWKQVGEKPEYPAAFVSDGNLMVTLWQVKDSANPVQFDVSAPQTGPAPEFAEQTDEILLELGLDWDRIIELKTAGAVT